jgi:hypothetical protein
VKLSQKDAAGQPHGPGAGATHDVARRRSSAGTPWTLTLQVLTALNVVGIALLTYAFVVAVLVVSGFRQLVTPATVFELVTSSVALPAGVLAAVVTGWVVLSLSPSPRVGPTRRSVALCLVLGGGFVGLIFAFVAASLVGALVSLGTLAVIVQTWDGTYRELSPLSGRALIACSVLLAPICLFTTAAGSLAPSILRHIL